MFNLGFKQIVLNEDTDPAIEATSGRLMIPGFCDISDKDSFGAVAKPVDPKGGEWKAPSYRPEIACKAASVTVKLSFDGPGLARNKTISFVSAPLIAADPSKGIVQGDVDKAIEAGWDAYIAEYGSIEESVVETLKSHNGKITVKIADDHAYLSLAGISYKTDNASVGVKATESKAATIGVGKGYMIESSVQLATAANLDPYNDTDKVIIDADYTTFSIFSKSDNHGWEAHEGLGYGDMNTDTLYGYDAYMVYVKSDSPIASSIETFVSGLQALPVN